MVPIALIALFAAGIANHPAALDRALDRQDRAAIEKLAARFSASAQRRPNDSAAQYQFALAESYLAQVAMELRDKKQAFSAAETGIRAAERAVALDANSAEYRRILGTLCGQAISGNGFAGLKYGKCALDAVNRALELDPKSAKCYVSRGVGKFYLPAAFGGGPAVAIRDFQKAIELDPRSDEAYLWLGIALRKDNRAAEARKALNKSIELNPNRLWTKQQLEKTPAR